MQSKCRAGSFSNHIKLRSSSTPFFSIYFPSKALTFLLVANFIPGLVNRARWTRPDTSPAYSARYLMVSSVSLKHSRSHIYFVSDHSDALFVGPSGEFRCQQPWRRPIAEIWHLGLESPRDQMRRRGGRRRQQLHVFGGHFVRRQRGRWVAKI